MLHTDALAHVAGISASPGKWRAAEWGYRATNARVGVTVSPWSQEVASVRLLTSSAPLLSHASQGGGRNSKQEHLARPWDAVSYSRGLKWPTLHPFTEEANFPRTGGSLFLFTEGFEYSWWCHACPVPDICTNLSLPKAANMTRTVHVSHGSFKSYFCNGLGQFSALATKSEIKKMGKRISSEVSEERWLQIHAHAGESTYRRSLITNLKIEMFQFQRLVSFHNLCLSHKRAKDELIQKW